MTDEETPITCRTTPQQAVSVVPASLASEDHGWCNEQIVEGYRRNNVLLQKYRSDERIRRCTVAEHLRAQTIDQPERQSTTRGDD
jgi:hypothetical protein